jgi:hypothetical protein
MKLAIRIARNYSINSLISGAMLDPLSQHPAPYYYGHHAWQAHEKQRRNFRTKLLAAWRSGQLSGNSSVGRALWPRHPADDSTGSPSAKSTNQRSLALAADVIQALNLLEHRDPAVWAANQRLVYTELLRWCMTRYGVIPKDPQATKIMEKCYYHLGLFHRWEAVEKSRGILISREIEKGLRWDRWRDSYRGLEFRTDTQICEGHCGGEGISHGQAIMCNFFRSLQWLGKADIPIANTWLHFVMRRLPRLLSGGTNDQRHCNKI